MSNQNYNMSNSIFITPFLAIMVILIFLQHHLVASLSPIQQKVALFQFKQSLNIANPPTDCFYGSYYGDVYYSRKSYPKTMNWSMSSDYCTWDGVTCEHNTGNIIGLDLSCSHLYGAILPNSTLFQLSHLHFLNLSQNYFYRFNQFPQEFGFFAKGLTHLNLSHTGFYGRVPSGISHLYKLISLDLSHNSGAVKLENEAFKSILQNLTQLRVLNLYEVNISSVLPVNLPTSLRVLNLMDTGLHGVLPQEVFHLPNLEVLALGSTFVNVETGLQAILPKVKWGSSGTLQRLSLRGINFHQGGIPDSIGFLESLARLELGYCNLSGPIPRSIGNLGQLTYLDLDRNNFTGPFPSFVAHFKGLIELDLRNNGFTGLLPTRLFNHLSLEVLHLSDNGFTGQLYDFNSTKSQLKYIFCDNNLLYGPIPQSFSQLVKLTQLDLSSNNFSGVLDMKVFSRLESLELLDLSSNNLLLGPIQQSFSQLVNLTWLDFSSNNFSGVLDMKVFSRLESLKGLDLSHNSLLSVRSSNTTTIPPKLTDLGLSSCNMKEFPHFSRDAEISLSWVDLSNNEIEGEIPDWIGSVGRYLNISHNRLTGGLEQLPWNTINYLDLESNNLNGSLPSLICNSSFLMILNLSNNSLTGVLPVCQTNLTSLSVFDLRMNKIQGNIPATLSNFRNLKSINLHGNKLEGRFPSSFAEFDKLETLDLGSNQINDTFPQCLEALPNLQVLVLKSNKFYGFVNKSSRIDHPFPSLRIIDLSYNEFSGPLPAMYFKNFKAMMNGDVNETKPRYMGDSIYSDSTSLVIKGVEIELIRILTVFTTIDMSCNNFEGKIVDYIGILVSLKSLNFSYNHLTGHIPPSIGKLSGLESLDLSSNQLEGEIPRQLTGIYWLARLNLSCNQLSGQIPKGPQFDTYDNDSYIGNFGLCGHPLSKTCENNSGIPEEEEEDEDDYYFFSGFTWEAVVIGYGCGVVPAFIIGYMMLLAGKPKWFAGIIARELDHKIRRMEIKWR